MQWLQNSPERNEHLRKKIMNVRATYNETCQIYKQRWGGKAVIWKERKPILNIGVWKVEGLIYRGICLKWVTCICVWKYRWKRTCSEEEMKHSYELGRTQATLRNYKCPGGLKWKGSWVGAQGSWRNYGLCKLKSDTPC